MQFPLSFDANNLLTVLPELILLALAFVVLAADLIWPETRKRGLGVLTAMGMTVALLVTVALWAPQGEGELAFGGMIRHDLITLVFRVIFLVAGIVTALISVDVRNINRQGEYYALLCMSVLGMSLMAASADLIMLYVSLETTSITLYLLAGYLRDSERSVEAGLKYFLFGAVSAAVMLYGLSLLYGLTGKTNIAELAAVISSGRVDGLVVLTASLLILVGLGFKISAVPFHFWAPDVYEGAPTPITAFVSTASKASGFAVLLRVFLPLLHPETGMPNAQWLSIFYAIAVVTMTLGNVLAIPQKNIKRLLAYSSIAQAGYVLVGFVAFSSLGVAAILFYLLMYAFTNLAAFTVVILFSNQTGSDELADFAGLSRRSPYLGLAMVLALLSLGGIPPLAGFFGKFFVFSAVVNQGIDTSNSWLIVLAVIGVINAIIGLYYYLYIAGVIFIQRSPAENNPIPVPRPYAIALTITIVGIIVMGVVATPWFNWAQQAAQVFFLASR